MATSGLFVTPRHASAAVELIALVVVVAAAAALVDPRGNFPLNDDWDFAYVTWNLAEHGRFIFSPFTAASVRLQAMWGALWTLLFGKSHEVLRASTLVLSAVMIVGVNRFLAAAGVARAWRLLGAVALLFHPIFFWSSFTYMTQVPYVALSFASFAAFWLGFRDTRLGFVLAGALLGIGSVFVRQTGIVNLLAPLLLLLLVRARLTPRWKEATGIVGSALILVVAVLLRSDVLFGSGTTVRSHWAAGITGEPSIGAAMSMVVAYTGFTVQNAGLFFLPLTVALAPLLLRATRRAWILAGAVTGLALLFATFYVVSGYPMPYPRSEALHLHGGNIFMDFGLGPPTLRDTWVLGYAYPFHAPRAVRVAITMAASILGALAVFFLIMSAAPAASSSSGGRSIALRLALTHAVLSTVVLTASGIYLDRYSLDAGWSLAVALPLILDGSSGRAMLTAGILTAMIAFFSIGATQEYLSWNRARWKAYEELRDRGVTLRQMDGGYEINLYLLGIPTRSDSLGKAGAAVVSDEYILAFNRVQGYRELGTQPYRGFFGMRSGVVRTLRRIERGPLLEP